MIQVALDRIKSLTDAISGVINVLLVVVTIVVGFIGGVVSNLVFMTRLAVAQENLRLWGNEPANLTKAEYFELLFKSDFHRHEDDAAANSYTLVSFFPAVSPDKAILLVVQTWNDHFFDDQRDLRRVIRQVADAELNLFDSLCELLKNTGFPKYF